MEKRRVEKNYVVIRDETFKLLNSLKGERQEKESYIVTNDVIIRDALQLYAKKR